jgi:hypothetical protein
MKFHKNPSSGSRVVRCGLRDIQMHRHDEANSRKTKLIVAILRKRLQFKGAMPATDT